MPATSTSERRKSNPQSTARRRVRQQNFKSDVQPKLEAARREWLIKARKVALELGRTLGQVTVDDVRRVISPPKNVDGRVMGILFHDGNWVCVGYRRSTRPECHHRPIGVFMLIAMAA